MSNQLHSTGSRRGWLLWQHSTPDMQVPIPNLLHCNPVYPPAYSLTQTDTPSFSQIQLPWFCRLSCAAQCGGDERGELYDVTVESGPLFLHRSSRTHSMHIHGELWSGCRHFRWLEPVSTRVFMTSSICNLITCVLIVVYVVCTSCERMFIVCVSTGGRHDLTNWTRLLRCITSSETTVSTTETSNSSSRMVTPRVSVKVRASINLACLRLSYYVLSSALKGN